MALLRRLIPRLASAHSLGHHTITPPSGGNHHIGKAGPLTCRCDDHFSGRKALHDHGCRQTISMRRCVLLHVMWWMRLIRALRRVGRSASDSMMLRTSLAWARRPEGLVGGFWPEELADGLLLSLEPLAGRPKVVEGDRACLIRLQPPIPAGRHWRAAPPGGPALSREWGPREQRSASWDH